MVKLVSLAEIAATVTLLSLFQWLGFFTASSLGLPVPGPVVGLILLLASLLIFGSPPAWFATRCSQLIGLLSLFFLPAGAGLFFLGDLMAEQWLPILVAIVVATPLSILITGGIMNLLLKGK